MSHKINWQAEQAVSLERIADAVEILVLNQKPNSRQVKDLQSNLLMLKYSTVHGVKSKTDISDYIDLGKYEVEE